MATDSLYVIDMAQVDSRLEGLAREKACWAARVAVDGAPSADGVAALTLASYNSWAAVFGDGAGAMIAFETVMTTGEGGQEPEEAYLGLLKLEHLDEMIAAAEGASDHGAADQVAGLRAIREACAANKSLRAAYYFDV